jgi:hypothetical protein
MRPEGLGNLIKIIHLIGSRTRDLQVCMTLGITNSTPHREDKGDSGYVDGRTPARDTS